MNLPRVYYTLPELAEKWKRSESDLLQMAAAGELELSVKHWGCGFDLAKRCFVFVDGYVQLRVFFIEKILEHFINPEIVEEVDLVGGHFVMWRGDEVWLVSDALSLEGSKARARKDDPMLAGVVILPLEVRDVTDLRILPAEVERMVSKFPKLAGRNETAAESVDQAHKETIHPGILYDISQKELAKKCGVTARTVSNWMKGGLLFESQGREKRVSLPLAIKWLKQNDKRNELETLNNSK